MKIIPTMPELGSQEDQRRSLSLLLVDGLISWDAYEEAWERTEMREEAA